MMAVAPIAALLLVACPSASTASCAFIVGDGTNDTKVHKIIYPGQVMPTLSYEKILYVPCNSRNFIINPPDSKDASGKPVGDRHTPIVATTKSGVSVAIWARGLWTLNQSEEAMRAFYNVCFKYTCYSTEDKGGTANFSTEGWNGMLGENFGFAMDTAGGLALASGNISDDIWKLHDRILYQKLGDAMSAQFADAMRQNLGYPVDLFCGSGNSAWKNPEQPGQGEFTCSPVRIMVDDVQVLSNQSSQDSEGAKTLNAQRLANAEALYGQDAGYWLGLQDSIDKCKAAGTTCIINIGGGGGGPAVTVPANRPTPVPTSTAVPRR